MVEHAWSVLCDRAIIDQQTNNIVLNVIEHVKFTHEAEETGKPLLMRLNGELVSLWYKEPGDKTESFGYQI